MGALTWGVKAMGYYKLHELTPEQREEVMKVAPKSSRFNSRVHCEPEKGCKYLATPTISPEGNVSICCHDMLEEYNTGNVIEVGSMRKIVESEAFLSIQRQGRARSLPMCKGCN